MSKGTLDALVSNIMEQHPIPQDVTGFQFKLIGTMTVKQFGFVASGVILAVILYYLPLHSAFGILTKVILVPLLGVSGVIIAFVPVDGRPIDIMTTNFMKALFSPNQYIYHRHGRRLSFEAVSVTRTPPVQTPQQKAQALTRTPEGQLNQKGEKLRALLLSSRGRIKNDIDKKEAAFLTSLTIPSQNTNPVIRPATPNHLTTKSLTVKQVPAPIQKPFITPAAPIAKPTAPLLPQTPIAAPKIPLNDKTPESLSKKELELEQALSQAKHEDTISKAPAARLAAQQKIAFLSKQIQDVHSQQQQLELELSHLQKQLISQRGTSATTPPRSVAPIQKPNYVKAIPQAASKNVGLPSVSDSPNVVVGIVKDPRGNILPNILVEVKDKEGNPVRAFKTNQLGQFASATPLSAATYTLELEDPKQQHRFDVIQIVANNQVLLPIEVISHDAREELRKQLFT